MSAPLDKILTKWSWSPWGITNLSPSRLILSAGIPVRFDKASNSFSKSTSSSPVTSGIWNFSRGIRYGWICVGS